MPNRKPCRNQEICGCEYQSEDRYWPCQRPWQTVLALSLFRDGLRRTDYDKQGHQNTAYSPSCKLFDRKLNASSNNQDNEHVAAGREQEVKQSVFFRNAEFALGPTSKNEYNTAKASECNGDFSNGVKKVLMHACSTQIWVESR